MPRSSNYGASYPDGTIVAHDNTVVSGPDEGTEDVPKVQESRPVEESDGKKTADERGDDNPRGSRVPTEDENAFKRMPKSNGTDEQPARPASVGEQGQEEAKPAEGQDSNVKPIKSTGQRKAATPKSN